MSSLVGELVVSGLFSVSNWPVELRCVSSLSKGSEV